MLKLQLKTSLSAPNLRPRFSWGRKRCSSCVSASSKPKRKVRFSLQPPIFIDSDYEMTESLQNALWYRPTDLQAISTNVVQSVHKAVMIQFGRFVNTAGSSSPPEHHCPRGLENLILDVMCPSQCRSKRHKKFVRGLLIMQQWQRKSNNESDELLRRYCLHAGSKQHETSARSRAEEDALFVRDEIRQDFLKLQSTKFFSNSEDDFVLVELVAPPPKIPRRHSSTRIASASRAA